MALTLWGLVLGIVAAMILGRILSPSMFGIRPVETLPLAGISSIFVLVALAACYFPARRAAAVSPIEAQRNLQLSQCKRCRK